jgi:plasmid stabilization system protein ParE
MPLKITLEAQFFEDLAKLTDSDTAERFSDRLLSRCEALLRAPGMGAPYGRKPGIRKINEGSYKIFYRVTESEVIILRLWDGRRGNDPYLPRK